MKFFRRFSLPLVLLAIAANASPQPAAEEAKAGAPEAEFQARVEKSNMYVKALNAISAVQRSFDRYTSWVDVKKGFTGKERYISYGLYEISRSTVDAIREAADKGPHMQPPLPELDMAIGQLAEAVSALAPVVKRAGDYYAQEDYKDDAAKLGEELHAQMMPLFERTFAAENELRRGLDTIKARLDQQQLAYVEKVSGRKFEWHLRSYLIAAKGIVGLLPPRPDAPVLAAEVYKTHFIELENTYNAFENFSSEHPDEVKKVLMASLVESAVKDFFAASKFLRRTLEAPKLDRREYVERIGEVAKTYNDLIQRTNNLR